MTMNPRDMLYSTDRQSACNTLSALTTQPVKEAGMAKPILSPKERFESKYIPEPNSGCWLWIASLAGNGYGQFDHRRAHRYSYELHKGPITEQEIDHKCCNKLCVNPDHLEQVSKRENNRRMWERGRGVMPPWVRAAVGQTHCLRGHEYTPQNTITDKRGRRACAACKKVAHKAFGIRRRERREAMAKS
jgi:hypothetical protein